MELYPKRKTDDEYVALIRKQVDRSKWFGYFHVVAAIAFVVMYFILWRLTMSASELVPEINSGLHIGIILGAFGGLLLVIAIQSIVWATQSFTGQRTERIMLKLYDELKKKEEASNQKKQAIACSEDGTVSA
jgi:hypothetical protein